MYWASIEEDPAVEIGYMSQRQKTTEEIRPTEFIEVKGWKAIGNKLVDKKLISIQEPSKEEDKVVEKEVEDVKSITKVKAVQAELFKPPSKPKPKKEAAAKKNPTGKPLKRAGKKLNLDDDNEGYLFAGDTIEFDV